MIQYPLHAKSISPLGFMELTIPLDPSLPAPLHRQLYEYLRDSILARRLEPGERMPSTRSLSESLRVSRTTVTLGYELLLSEGYLETVVGSGTYVSPSLPGELLPGSDPDTSDEMKVRLSEYARRLARAAPPPERPGDGRVIDFRHGRPDYARFPITTWRRILLRHCRANDAEMLDYARDSRGYVGLRDAIARYFARARAVRCTAEQVIIVNGSQQALDLIARVLINKGEIVAIENPCYGGALRAFQSHGARLLPVPVDESGIVVDHLKSGASKKARLVYITPSHQFPSGFVLTLDRRLQLLDWARSETSMIVEDDYDSEYRYHGHPLPSVQGLEPEGRVLYMGTFSKVLFPSLRIGYLVVPQSLSEVFARAKWLADRHTAMLEQYALADFIREGHLDRHIRRMRSLYNRRRQVLVTEFLKHLGKKITVQGENAGMHILVRLHSRFSSDEIVKRAAQRGVAIRSAESLYLKAGGRNEFVFGYANLTETQIRAGVEILAGVLS